MREAIYLDFEYYNTSEPMLSVVCCAVLIKAGNSEIKKCYWLHDDEASELEDFKEMIYQSMACDALFLSYNVIAEAGALYSLGIGPNDAQWVDIMTEWKQLRNGNDARLYGKYIDKSGKPKTSTPPPPIDYTMPIEEQKRKKGHTSHAHTGTNLLSCVYNLLGVDLGADHKKAMQNRILQGGPFTEQERIDICDYAISDVNYLSDCMRIIARENMNLSGLSYEAYISNALIRGEWSARLAVMERVGIPINYEWLKNIAKNHDTIKDAVVSSLVETTYPFYEKAKKGGWVEKNAAFVKYLEDNKLTTTWPKTPAGGYKKDKETLENYEYLSEILEFRRVKEMLGQIRSFSKTDGFEDVMDEELEGSPNTEGTDTIFKRIGRDKRLRCYFNPYGTQTTRNAPPSRNFIFAMSAWLRSAVQPPPGYAITAIDYSSEEFIIAACESEDKTMEAVYDSGDVYLGFAKRAKAVPPDATKTSHAEQRDAFKATCIAYGSLVRVKDSGFKPIQDVTKDDLVWDGIQWRKCHGSRFMGVKNVIPMNNFWCTEDHKILVNGEWIDAGTIQGNNEKLKEKIGRQIHLRTTPGLREAPANWKDVWALARSLIRSYF